MDWAANEITGQLFLTNRAVSVWLIFVVFKGGLGAKVARNDSLAKFLNTSRQRREQTDRSLLSQRTEAEKQEFKQTITTQLNRYVLILSELCDILMTLKTIKCFIRTMNINLLEEKDYYPETDYTDGRQA